MEKNQVQLQVLAVFLSFLMVASAGAQGREVAQADPPTVNRPAVRPVRPIRPTLPKKQLELPQLRANPQMNVPYYVIDDVATGDLQTVFVVASHFVARWDRRRGRQTHRLDLKPYSHQTDTQVRIALDPRGTTLYVALDQVNSPSAEAPDVPQYQLLLLAVDAQRLRVRRQMPFGAFDTPSGAQPEKVYALTISSDGKAAYTFGFYPKVGDSGTVGSIAWSDLAAWKHGDIQYIQDIVERSGVRVARDAEKWKFRHAKPVFLSTGRMLILSDHTDGGVLEGSVNSRSGLRPMRTIAALAGCTPHGLMDGRLCYEDKHGNVRSLPTDGLAGEGTFHFPSPGGDLVLSHSDKRVLVGGRQGLWIYDAAAGKSDRREEFSQEAMQGAKVVKLHAGRQPGQVLVRLSKRASGEQGGRVQSTASYVLFDYAQQSGGPK